MGLKGLFQYFSGNGPGGVFLGDGSEPFDSTRANILRADIAMASTGAFAKSIPVGGSKTTGILAAVATDVIDADEFVVDNTSSYVSGSADLIVTVLVHLRVENAAISVTPRVYNVTTAAVATTTGALACAATNDDYSGTNQKQTLTLTLLAGVNTYKLQVTPTAATYQVWAKGWRTVAT